MGKFVRRLVDEPAFFRVTENLGYPQAISGDMPRLPLTSSESVLRVTPSAAVPFGSGVVR